MASGTRWQRSTAQRAARALSGMLAGTVTLSLLWAEPAADYNPLLVVRTSAS